MEKLFALVASTCFLSGCSDDTAKNEIKQILECSMAAKLVGQTAKIDSISNHVNWATARSGYEPSVADVKQMHDEIKAKWNLKSMPRQHQDQLLVDVYNSKTCRALHQGNPLSVNDVPPDA